MYPRRQVKTNGFTLVELMIVVAVIAMLIAVSMSAYARARANAKRTACLSDIREINIGLQQYIQDFDEFFPYATGGGSGNLGWGQAIQPYCLLSTEYFYNSNLNGVKSTAFTFMGNTVSFGDSATGGYSDIGANTGGFSGCNSIAAGICADPPGSPALLNAADRHLDGSNYAFADGHVKWQSSKGPTISPGIYSATTAAASGVVSFAP